MPSRAPFPETTALKTRSPVPIRRSTRPDTNLGLKALKMPQRKVPLVDSLQEVGPEASEKDHKALSNFCAFDAATGKILWHTWMPQLTSNGAQTHRVDGFQFVVVAAQDTIYAFTLNP